MPDNPLPIEERFLQLNGTRTVDPVKVHQRIGAVLSVLKILDREAPSMEALVAIASVKQILEDALGECVEVRLLAAGSKEEILAQQRMLKDRYERTGSLADPPTAPTSTTVQ